MGLVVGLMVVLSAIIMPNFLREFEREQLPGSARQLRSLLTLVGANAAFEGKRYRVRFPEDDEHDSPSGWQQPLIEREDDPIRDPEVFNPVTAPWATGRTLLGDVWCAEVRLGRPTVDTMRETRSGVRDALNEAFREFAPERPPLMVEPDASSPWVTFVLTDAPRETAVEELEDYARIEVIMDGMTGLAWLQRPFYDEELDLFEEKNWPVVLRQDFLTPRPLTEDDVLELREFSVKP